MSENSKQFTEFTSTLNKVKNELESLKTIDTSAISVDFEWSAIPVVEDHINFLFNQVCGLLNAVKDAPPPELHKLEIES